MIDEVLRTARMRDYGKGVVDGFEIVLRLLLGEEAAKADPFTGPLTPECEAWARQALQRIEEERS